MTSRTLATVVIALSLGGVAGCKKKPKEGQLPPEKMGSMVPEGSGSAVATPAKEAKLEGKALADRYIECSNLISTQKWDDFKAKCLAAGYKVHAADYPGTQDADTAIGMMKGQFAGFPDMKLSPQVIAVNGRNLLAVSLMTGTHTAPLKSPMGELAPTNKKIGMLMFHRIQLDDENKAVEEWAYNDPMTLGSQLGVMPKEAGPGRPALEKGLEGAPIVAVATDDAKEKANIDLFNKSQVAFQSKKAADYMAFYADDAFESDQAGTVDAKGKKDIQAGSEMFLKAFPDLKLETPNVFAAGDYVIVLGTLSGTHTGPLGPVKATKKKVASEYAEVVEIKDGKIAKLWRFRNGMSMAQQLGLMPDHATPPAEKPAEKPAGSAAPPAGSAAPPAGSAAAPAGSAAAPAGSAK
jgi:predicted ester cyclase